MEQIAIPIEEVLDKAVATTAVISLWLGGRTLAACRALAWSRGSGVVVCRGGDGYTEEDFHYIRVDQIQGVTIRTPAPRSDSDRLGPEVRDALRGAAGYPVSLVIRPEAFSGAPEPLAAWLKTIVEAITALCALEPHREGLQAAVDQILLREGPAVAVLGGSTLILEATPEETPSPEILRTAIEALL